MYDWKKDIENGRKHSFVLIPHPDDQRIVYAVWQEKSAYRGYKWPSGFFEPTEEDVRFYAENRSKMFQVPGLSSKPLCIYPHLHHAPQWVRMGAAFAGIRKGYALIYESGYTYIPDRLRAIVYPAAPNRKPLRLYSEDEDILVHLTWKHVKRAKKARKVTASDKDWTCGIGRLPAMQLVWSTTTNIH